MAVEAYGKENRQEGKKPSRPSPPHTHTFPTGAVHLPPDLGAFRA